MFYLLAFYFPVIEVIDRIKTFSRSLFFQLFFLIPLTSAVSVSATNLIGWRGLYCMRKWYLQVLSGAWHSGKNSLSLTSAMRNSPCCMSDNTNRLTWFYQAAERCYFFLFDCCLLLNYQFNERLLATNLDSVLNIHNHLYLQFKWSDYVTQKCPLV